MTIKYNSMQKNPSAPKVGDYCTSYFKGIFKLLNIDYSPEISSNGLAELEMICDSQYNKRSGKKNCDIHYCKVVTKEQLLKAAEETHKSLVEKIHNVL